MVVILFARSDQGVFLFVAVLQVLDGHGAAENHFVLRELGRIDDGGFGELAFQVVDFGLHLALAFPLAMVFGVFL